MNISQSQKSSEN